MRFYCPCVFIFHRKSGLQIVLAVRRTGDADYSDWAEQGGFMKLQTRIMVGFFMIILVPLLLFAATLHGMREAQIRGPKRQKQPKQHRQSMIMTMGSPLRIQKHHRTGSRL